jgi:hypothetical protein
MARPKLTPWFRATVKPARPGVYRVRAACPWYRFWDGSKWFVGASTPRDAAAYMPRRRAEAADWRGLAQPPK